MIKFNKENMNEEEYQVLKILFAERHRYNDRYHNVNSIDDILDMVTYEKVLNYCYDLEKEINEYEDYFNNEIFALVSSYLLRKALNYIDIEKIEENIRNFHSLDEAIQKEIIEMLIPVFEEVE